MTLATIVQARMGSTRLPGKVLKKVGGQPILEHVIARIGMCEADTGLLVVATTAHAHDDPIVELCDELGIECFRGSERDVLNRYQKAAALYGATEVLRVTADMPLLCPDLTAEILGWEGDADYVTCENVPLGLAPELITAEALERCWRDSRSMEEREHVTLHALNHPSRFRLSWLPSEDWLFDRHHWRLTLDTPEDLDLLERLYIVTGGLLFELPTREIVDAVESNMAIRALAERA